MAWIALNKPSVAPVQIVISVSTSTGLCCDVEILPAQRMAGVGDADGVVHITGASCS